MCCTFGRLFRFNCQQWCLVKVCFQGAPYFSGGLFFVGFSVVLCFRFLCGFCLFSSCSPFSILLDSVTNRRQGKYGGGGGAPNVYHRQGERRCCLWVGQMASLCVRVCLGSLCFPTLSVSVGVYSFHYSRTFTLRAGGPLGDQDGDQKYNGAKS